MSIRGTQGPASTGAVIHELRRARTATRASADVSPVSSDTAGITDTARLLNEAQSVVNAAIDFRPSRVNELRLAIANGTYQADDREVARKLLDRGL